MPNDKEDRLTRSLMELTPLHDYLFFNQRVMLRFPAFAPILLSLLLLYQFLLFGENETGGVQPLTTKGRVRAGSFSQKDDRLTYGRTLFAIARRSCLSRTAKQRGCRFSDVLGSRQTLVRSLSQRTTSLGVVRPSERSDPGDA